MRDLITYRTLLCAIPVSFLMLACADDDEASGLSSFGASEARLNLDSLGGCFSVRYQFVEDSSNDFLEEGNIEYIDVADMGDLVLARNFLVLPDGGAFFHWYQEWRALGDGRWSLAVFDGADNLRYETEGVWRLNQWESEPARAVKPTRDEDRTDYDYLERRNLIQFVEDGWVQSEINTKMTEADTPVATELGWIIYSRLASDDACAAALPIAQGT